MIPGNPSPPAPVLFGLIVIGDEVLNGPRIDKHLGHFRAFLAEQGHGLAWHWVLPDDPEVLTAHLRFSLARPEPVLACGGIGATPDDYTRACAAAAAGVRLVPHPEAQWLIESRFGEEAYPYRVLMADLPEGCTLIPNPYNQIPGFRLRDHFFLPGFPEMAWPMADQVVAQHYPPATPARESALRVLGVPESRLVPIMLAVGPRHPTVKLFSLPHLGTERYVLLGFRGRAGLEAALADLKGELEAAGLDYRMA
jgi:molybdopterin-biosynthesis enzyme MoeA-like protein